MFNVFLQALLTVVTSPSLLVIVFLGVAAGIIFGAIPGLTSTMAIIMFLPLTYALPPLHAISLLVALYIGGISGGLVPAILLNIPGTPSSIATCFDGWPMSQHGNASKALGIGIFFSFMGTIIGLVFLVILSPILASFAVRFGPYEYCSLVILSFALAITIAGKDLLKGLISVVLGAIIATVGLSPIDSMKRFTFDNYNLISGFSLNVVLIGLFAVTEVLKYVKDATSDYENTYPQQKLIMNGFGFSISDFYKQLPNMFRSALIGLAVGILPGIGGSISSMLSYTVSKKVSKEPTKYGTGIIDGIVASETANNATISGAMIPLLSLGIPGDGTTAVLLGGLIISGISPGPLIFEKNGMTVCGVFAAMAVASIFMIAIEFIGLRFFVRLMNVPKSILYPIIMVFGCVGAIGGTNRIFDCWGIIIFGLIGYFLSEFNFPVIPVVMGFILGPILELNIRRVAMLVTYDSVINHPIALVICMIIGVITLRILARQHVG